MFSWLEQKRFLRRREEARVKKLAQAMLSTVLISFDAPHTRFQVMRGFALLHFFFAQVQLGKNAATKRRRGASVWDIRPIDPIETLQ